MFTPGHAGKVPVDAIVACPGLGARTLGGIEDGDVYPVRGQVVMLRAPWIKFGRTASHGEQGLWTYIIPRRSGDVRPLAMMTSPSLLTRRLGHCRWHEGRQRLVSIYLHASAGLTDVETFRYPVARPETTTEILERGLALCPELAPPEVRTQRPVTVEDLRPIIIEEGCGFRPSRKGGLRLDVEWIKAGTKEIPLVFNYG